MESRNHCAYGKCKQVTRRNSGTCKECTFNIWTHCNIFGHIVIYLQVHIIKEPAYKVLLGRPFDSVTESLVKNKKNGSQTLTLTDPNTGERCEMSTYERGKQPGILPKPLNMDFPLSMN